MKDEGNRQYVRLREDIPVHWHVIKSGLKGNGTVRNLSLTGLLLESTTLSALPKESEIMITSLEPNTSPFSSCRAKFKWGRMALSSQRHYFSGLEFVSLSKEDSKKIKEHLAALLHESGIGIIENYLGLND